jgi:prolyl 4-hydroxylase
MTQTATPALRTWIIEQTAAGFAPDAVLGAMVEAGWAYGLAVQTLEETLNARPKKADAAQASLPAEDRNSGNISNSSAGGEMRVGDLPDIVREGGQSLLDLGDRQVAVLASLASPRVVVLGGLLSDQECEALIAAARPRLARSLTVQTVTGGEELNPDRTSNGMFFSRGESDLIRRIEARIARLVHWPVENGEGMQVLHYGVGAEYKPHFDYFDPAEPGTPTILKRGGQRLGTLVIYLNEPERGGGTTFPDVGLEVAPQRGHAVFFNYDKPHPSTRTLHGGAPVLAGEKWVATKWLRERVFE